MRLDAVDEQDVFAGANGFLADRAAVRKGLGLLGHHNWSSAEARTITDPGPGRLPSRISQASLDPVAAMKGTRELDLSRGS